jgi:allophanate hydrolase subunit 2
MEGPTIAHKESADIISDGICMGSVQVPGHGQPIVMLADRQTTGGYTKIAVVCTVDAENLAQRLPGQKIRFTQITADEAVALLKEEAALFEAMRRTRAAWRSRPRLAGAETVRAERGAWNMRVDGEPHRVDWVCLP